MLIAYVDESGNTGTVASGGSLTFTLGCVLVDAAAWPTAFDELLAMRRRVRDRFGLPMRAEVRANDLIRASGDIRNVGLAPTERLLIFRAHMAVMSALPARAFAVVVDKRNQTADYFDLAWEGLLQRLERTSTHEQQPFMVVHDEGANDQVRAWVRRSRRYLTAGSATGYGTLRNPARLLVDDPVPRTSRQSYFIQAADLVAYAAFRAVIAPSANVARVCPQTMWNSLGDAIHRKVNSLKRVGPPGIVIR